MKYLATTCGLILLGAPVAEARNLNKSEIEKTIIGKTVTFVTKNKSTGKVRYSKNGTMRMSNTNFDPKSDKGTWRFKGNRFCAKWKIIRKGKEKCFTMKSLGGNKYANQDGTIMTVR